MKFEKTKIKNLYIIETEPRSDDRGCFARIFCQNELATLNIAYKIAQINQSLTKQKGTIRGMHFQRAPRMEDKIVQCLQGAIFDVAIDLRENSPTYRQWVGVELTAENNKLFLIPKGFAHGFQTLTDYSRIQYFVSEYYSPENESGVRWDDPLINIKWPIENSILSKKDQSWPLL